MVSGSVQPEYKNGFGGFFGAVGCQKKQTVWPDGVEGKVDDVDGWGKDWGWVMSVVPELKDGAEL